MNPVLMVSTNISGDSNDIDGKMFIFQTKPSQVQPLKSMVLEKQALSWWFQHTFLIIVMR